MKEPQHFQKVFWGSMIVVSLVMATVACLSVIAFGHVTNGSITAFLLDTYRDDDSITSWLMVANTLVSLSVLLTYPLMLFPTLEIIGTGVQRLFGFGLGNKGDEDEEEKDLDGFEPLPPLPEDREASQDIPEEHFYADEPNGEDDDDKDDEFSQSAKSAISSTMHSIFPEMILPGDSPQLRLGLVLLTYSVAVVVPNVQALISLVGALAGSSTALLIPPLLELAWIRQLETDLNLSSADDGRYRFDKVKSYFLLLLGFIFLAIGTFASLADIVAIYRSG
jgi:hypothetical protein